MKLSPIFVTLLAAGSTLGSSALECNETDALLKVTYSIDKDSWDNFYEEDDTLRFGPDLRLRPSWTAGNSTTTFDIEYDTFEDLIDFEACVPRAGACLELTVSVFPKDSYEISWDGESIETGPEFEQWGRYPITTTEIGDSCIPVCDESTEALFEYKYWTGGNHFDAYRVEDMHGNMVLGCDTWHCRAGIFSRYVKRACLVRESCYLFLNGDQFQWDPALFDDSPSFSVHYDGELLEESDNWLFKSLYFGEGCVPPCDAEDGSLVEFFMDRSFSMCDEPDFPWELKVHEADGVSVDGSIISSGAVSSCSNVTLRHERMCVPKDSCYSFFISSLNDDPRSPRYSLTLDEITYRNADWHLFLELNQTTNLGRCTVSALCDGTSQALFEMTLHTPDEYVTEYGNYSSIHGLDWFLAYSNVNEDDREYSDTLLRGNNYFDTYQLGSLYHAMECVTNEECFLDFGITTGAPVENYTVKRSGTVQSNQGIDHESGYFWGHTTSAFGCPQQAASLSGGAIAGIAVASVFVAGAALYFVGRKIRQAA